jgi:hypothetical protein
MDPTDNFYLTDDYTFRSESGNDSESESEMDTPIEALGFNQVYGATHDGFLMRFVLSSSSGVTYRYGEGWCHYTQRWFQEPTYTPVDRPHFAHALVDEDRVYHIYLGARNRHDTLFVLQETYPNRDLHCWELETRRDVRQLYYYITGNEPEMLGNDESEEDEGSDEDQNEGGDEDQNEEVVDENEGGQQNSNDQDLDGESTSESDVSTFTIRLDRDLLSELTTEFLQRHNLRERLNNHQFRDLRDEVDNHLWGFIRGELRTKMEEYMERNRSDLWPRVDGIVVRTERATGIPPQETLRFRVSTPHNEPTVVLFAAPEDTVLEVKIAISAALNALEEPPRTMALDADMFVMRQDEPHNGETNSHMPNNEVMNNYVLRNRLWLEINTPDVFPDRVPVDLSLQAARDHDHFDYHLEGEFNTTSVSYPPEPNQTDEQERLEVVGDRDSDHEDHAEFLGLFVQRGDVVRTNDGEEEYVYDPAAYPEDSD